MGDRQRVLVTGGAGYVGSVLVPKLLRDGYRVRVLDLYLYGDHVLKSVKDDPHLEQIKGDIRDRETVRQALTGCVAVIHLACISNDPSCELDPELSRTINYEAFVQLLDLCQASGIQRFIFASSASVYGISDAPEVAEDHARVPMSDYNRYKAMCEDELMGLVSPSFAWVIIRPATVCGYSPRQRLDLTVNILTNHAVNTGRITVFGGAQMRPNIHIEDITDLYVLLLALPADRIAGRIYNAGYENSSVMDLAERVQEVVRRADGGRAIEIVTTPSDDPRSYRISSARLEWELGFRPRYGIERGVRDLLAAFRDGRLPNPMTDARYYNLKQMQAVRLQ